MNVLRWFNHIKSFGDDVPRFPGVAKDVSEYGPIAAAPLMARLKLLLRLMSLTMIVISLVLMKR